MSNDRIHLKVITHEKVIYDKDVISIVSNGINGQFGVLKNHLPFMTTLNIGVTKAEIEPGKFDYIATIGGIFQIKNNQAVILSDEALMGNDIDLARAKQAKERAQARLANSKQNIDVQRAELALARALARLKAATKVSINS